MIVALFKSRHLPHCYLPSICCCKLLENRVQIITLPHMPDPHFLPALSWDCLGVHQCGVESSILDKIRYFIGFRSGKCEMGRCFVAPGRMATLQYVGLVN